MSERLVTVDAATGRLLYARVPVTSLVELAPRAAAELAEINRELLHDAWRPSADDAEGWLAGAAGPQEFHNAFADQATWEIFVQATAAFVGAA